jgi:hypothetical protein
VADVVAVLPERLGGVRPIQSPHSYRNGVSLGMPGMEPFGSPKPIDISAACLETVLDG